MKKFMLLLAVAIVSSAAYAQSDSRREWLGNFNTVSLSGDMKVRLIRNSENAQPMIVVKSADQELSKLKYSVNSKGLLTVHESSNNKRTVATEIEIYFSSITDLKIAGCDVEVEGTLNGQLLDIEVSGGGFIKADIDVADLLAKVSGNSTLDIQGKARYMMLDVTVAKVDLRRLETMSAEVSATQRGEATVYATERLAATTNMGGSIFYMGAPSIVRANSKLLGSSINNIGE